MILHRMSLADLDTLVGRNLRRLRDDAALGLADVGALTGIGPERLAPAERGAVHLSAFELSYAARAFGCPFAALFAMPAPARLAS